MIKRKVNTEVGRTRRGLKRYAFAGIGAVALAVGLSAPAFAAGSNQYGGGFPISSSGYCHGAFSNINGNFGSLGSDNGSGAQGIGGGVPVSGSAGSNNSAVSGDCTLPN